MFSNDCYVSISRVARARANYPEDGINFLFFTFEMNEHNKTHFQEIKNLEKNPGYKGTDDCDEEQKQN